MTTAGILIAQTYTLPANLALVARDYQTVEIRLIYVQHRGQGAGSLVLKAITLLADSLGVTLTVTPRSAVEHGWWIDNEDFSDALNQDDLEKWYLRHGFEFVGDNTFVRQPQALS